MVMVTASGLPSGLKLVQNKTTKVPRHRDGDEEGRADADLLIRTERMLMVVEVKRNRQIGHEIIAEVEEKVRRLRHDGRLSVRTALVYDGKLSASVPADRYFDFIVSSDDLI